MTQQKCHMYVGKHINKVSYNLFLPLTCCIHAIKILSLVLLLNFLHLFAEIIQ